MMKIDVLYRFFLNPEAIRAVLKIEVIEAHNRPFPRPTYPMHKEDTN